MNKWVDMLNDWGGRFLEAAWPMFWQSGVLIALIFALDLALRKRVRATTRYALWLLVLAKLVVPASLSLPTGVGYWVPAPTALTPAPMVASALRAEKAHTDERRPAAMPVVQAASLPPADLAAGQTLQQRRDSTTAQTLLSEAAQQRGPTDKRTTSAASQTLHWRGVAALFWLAGMAGLAGVLAYRTRLTRQLIAGAAGTEEFAGVLSQCASRMGVRRRVTLRLSGAAAAPAVCGLFRPIILLPTALASRLSAAQMEAVLLHELAHVRRGDPWVNYFQALLQIFYFYNPLLWLANAAIRRVREEAVDELVLVAMGDEASLYPETLLQVARLTMQTARPGFGWVGILEKRSTVGGRIRLMLRRPWPKSARLGLRGGIAVAALAAVLLPMSSRPQQQIPAPGVASSLQPTPLPASGTTPQPLPAALKFISGSSPTNASPFRETTHKHQTEIARAWDMAVTNIVRELQGLAPQDPALSDITPASIANGWLSYLKNGRYVTNHVETPQTFDDFTVPQLDPGGAALEFGLMTHDESMLPIVWHYPPLLKLGGNAGFYYRYDFHLNPPDPALEKSVKDIVEKQAGILRKTLQDILASDSAPQQAKALVSVPSGSPAVNALCAAIYDRHWAEAMKMIDSGVPVNGVDERRRTPLGCLVEQWSNWTPQDETPGNQVLRKLLEHGGNPYAPSARTWNISNLFSPVEYATSDPAIVGPMLLTNNANPIRRTVSGETALHLAVRLGYAPEFFKGGPTATREQVLASCINLIDILLSHGFSPDQTNADGLTPLQVMAGCARPDTYMPASKPPPYFMHLMAGGLLPVREAVIADFLLSRGATLDVFSAAAMGLTNQLAGLLRSNPQLVNARDGFGRTPLYYAAPFQTDAMTLLLEAGADPAARTARRFAGGAVTYRVEPAGFSPLQAAVESGNQANVELLLKAGAPLAQADADGNTPLHTAAYRTSAKLTQLLISAGAPLDATNRAGWTPLRFGIYAGGSGNLTLLLKAGARRDIGLDNTTPLQVALAANCWTAIRELVAAGLPVDERDGEGRTPFQHAVTALDLSRIQMLLTNGADINAVDLHGNTALHQLSLQPRNQFRQVDFSMLAQKLGQGTVTTTNISLTGWLLDHGANPNLTNHDGQTPLDLLRTNKWTNSDDEKEAAARIALLLKAGAKVRGENEPKSGPVPDQICVKLQALFQKYYPKATFTNQQANGIRFEYETGTFEFPPVNPAAGKQENPKENPIQRGPKQGGIMCNVYLEYGEVQRPIGSFPAWRRPIRGLPHGQKGV